MARVGAGLDRRPRLDAAAARAEVRVSFDLDQIDRLLTTTRSVRKRLDFDRPVERAVVEECLTSPCRHPTGSNRQGWHWVVVSDAAKKRAICDVYRTTSPSTATGRRPRTDRRPTSRRAQVKVSRLGDVPRRQLPPQPAAADPLPLGAPRRRLGTSRRVRLGVAAAGGVELHAGAARAAAWDRRGPPST